MISNRNDINNAIYLPQFLESFHRSYLAVKVDIINAKHAVEVRSKMSDN